MLRMPCTGFCDVSLRCILHACAFSSPEPTILLTCRRDRELWPVPKYAQSQWRCIFVTVGNHYCFKLLSLRRRVGSPWFTDFLIWNQPELSIPAAGQKDRGLWGREWCLWRDVAYSHIWEAKEPWPSPHAPTLLCSCKTTSTWRGRCSAEST